MEKKSLYYILPAVPILLYLIFATIEISLPGIQYDEILFGNAARGGIDGSFITYKIRSFPILLMPYIGALKAYIYYPIFKLFGVSAYSIRVPMVFLSALSLLFLFQALKRFSQYKIAIVSVFILSMDPSFLAFTRYDVGPTAIGFFLKIISLYFFALFLEKRKNLYLICVVISLYFGLFNKLNYIWYINGLFISAFIVYWKELKVTLSNEMTSHSYLFISFPMLAYLFFAGYFLFINISYRLLTRMPSNLFQRFGDIYNNLKNMTNGQIFYNYAIGEMNLSVAEHYWIIVLIVISIGFIIRLYNLLISKDKTAKDYWFFLIILILLLFQIALTKDATAPWHIFSSYPFIIIIVVYSVFFIIQNISSGAFRAVIMVCYLISVVYYNLYIDYRYLNMINLSPRNISWSEAIYDLINYTQRCKNEFVSIDWGTHTQLIAFYGFPGKYREVCFWLNQPNLDDENKKWFSEEFFKLRGKYLFILHPENKTFFKEARRNLFSLARESNVKLYLEKELRDNGKNVIYEIYGID